MCGQEVTSSIIFNLQSVMFSLVQTVNDTYITSVNKHPKATKYFLLFQE